ncbi:MAG TPA: hypothetical protein VGG99_05625 [Acetobacteraceae bacterium]
MATQSVQMFPQVPVFHLNRFATPRGVKFFAVPDELRLADWHTAPERQLAVALTSTVEHETSDGEIRRCPPGAAVLVEDATGRGHITRFDPDKKCFLHIAVPDDGPAT